MGGELGAAFWLLYNDPTKTLREIEEIAKKPEVQKEISKIQRQGVTEEELENAREYLTRGLIFNLEENDSLVTWLIRMYLFNLGWDHLYRFTGLLQQITSRDIQQASKKYLHPKLDTTVVVGPCVQ